MIDPATSWFEIVELPFGLGHVLFGQRYGMFLVALLCISGV
jgi:hypothetical protein